jgi:hypothetical protein
VSGPPSPLSRGPLFDGAATIHPYPWVSPPPDLAPTNQLPTPGTATITLGAKGNETLNLQTADGIFILLLPAGTIPSHGSDTHVKVDVTPLDPGTLAPLSPPLSPFGNAYRVTATYLPSRDAVTATQGKPDVVMQYPVTANLYATTHTVYYARKGTRWEGLKTTSLPALQQVEALTPGLGYVLVGGVKGPNPITPSPVNTGGASSPLAISLMVGAAAALLVGFALVLRNSRRGLKKR